MPLRAAKTTDYPRLVEIWEAATRATHDFLGTAEIDYLRPLIATAYLPSVEVTVYVDAAGRSQGFCGIQGDKIEMLFVHPSVRGQGIGRHLVEWAIATHAVSRVDVNEQNSQALGFYRRMGFEPFRRSPTDAQGRPFPILHLSLGGQWAA